MGTKQAGATPQVNHIPTHSHVPPEQVEYLHEVPSTALIGDSECQ